MGRHYVVTSMDIADGDLSLQIKGVFHDLPHARACFDATAKELRKIAEEEGMVIDDGYFSELEQFTAYEEGYASQNCVNARIIEVVDNSPTTEF